MKYGQKLYNLRKIKGFSQERIAEELEVTRQSVSLWETDNASPSMENLISLAKLFEISLDELVGMEKFDDDSMQNKKMICEISYIDNKSSILRRDFIYSVSSGDLVRGILSIFLFVNSVSFLLGAININIYTYKAVFFIVSLACLFLSILIYPYYIYRSIKNKLRVENDIRMYFYDDYLRYKKTNSFKVIDEKIDYKAIEYYIEKSDYILLFLSKDKMFYIPKYNCIDISNFLLSKIEKRTRKKTIFNK